MNYKVVGVIPARLESSRLARKIMADIGGKTLLQRVWEQASRAKHLSRIIIATDAEEIFAHASSFGALAHMTSNLHISGTDRMAEVAKNLLLKGEQIEAFANIQGDMPFIDPSAIDHAIESLFAGDSSSDISTLAVPIYDPLELSIPSVVKVVMNSQSRAMYFSRSAIPYNAESPATKPGSTKELGFKHVGLYVYRTKALLEVTCLPPSKLEKLEKLEQLRALSAGYKIKVAVLEQPTAGMEIHVDTPSDLESARDFCKDFKQ